MKNLFTGAQVKFTGKIIDNTAYNARFDRDGFRQHMLPAKETSIQVLERILKPFEKYGIRIEREFTNRDGFDGTNITYYLSSSVKMTKSTKHWLSELEHEHAGRAFNSITFGSMKVNATFVPSKNQ